MNKIYLYLSFLIHLILALLLPYQIMMVSTCLYYIGFFMGKYSAPDLIGEENLFAIILIITLLFVSMSAFLLIFSYGTLFKKAGVKKGTFCIVNLTIFLLVCLYH
ncbi:hypothetical protein QD46_25570 [Paenibacillus polymyxa]|nr:hypothetical protein QD46_25570 [Paenibacillus polymyxa]KZE68183.1 hypothetical protein AV545_22590 [Paenibacillus jamilae]